MNGVKLRATPINLRVCAKAEFAGLTEPQVITAMREPNSANAITLEVERLILGYGHYFSNYVECFGYIPASVMRQPDTAIEAVALRMAEETIREHFANLIESPSASSL